ncbi:type IV pilus assembly protein PilF [Roseateles sp. YR242]|uniref:type IV pilus biogenesis/stability protein PilW n=1 Tax=Roseateles sp. YR242 TaxID=1855305 RepID=UPI0008B562F7|nr:type IV pilus biogenesis/stability protein PilW [Roseateles sp. YR242]SEL55812.1 type IV pilus assembly protein PilF [Roseateles sp. YR242]
MTSLTPGFKLACRTARILSVALMVGALLPGCGTPSASVRQEPKTASDATDADRRAAVRMELATAYFSRGQYETALDELKQALAIKPDLPDAVSLRSLIYAAMGDYVAAEEGFKRGLAVRQDADTLHNYGWFLCQRQRFAEASKQFEAALAIPTYRTPGRTWLAWGVCDARSGQMPNAHQHLLKAFEYEPGNPTVAVNLGEVLYRQGDYEKARFYARRVNNNQEQSNASSLWLELRIERRMGNTANMEDLAKQLRSKYPQAAETQALNSGRFDE